METISSFGLIALCAIGIGGLLVAFSARAPKTHILWVSAYLVLVVGLAQLLLDYGLGVIGSEYEGLAISAFFLFNLGSALVIYGTWCKWTGAAYRSFVCSGSAFFVVALLFLVFSIREASYSLTLIWFIGLIVLLFVSLSTGLIVSLRKPKKLAEE